MNDDRHYHYRISLRIWHPDMDPQSITDAVGINPKISWKSGNKRTTPNGKNLPGFNKTTYWVANIASGKFPENGIENSINSVLNNMIFYRCFFHKIRSEGGRVELFCGWFFEKQSGSVFPYSTLTLAGDLQIDLALDIYPPTQPQNEYDISEST
jgi:hypothetical protein